MKKGVKRQGRSQSTDGAGIAGLTDEIVAAYRERRTTQAEIADQLSVTRAVVAKAFKARGVVQDTVTNTKKQAVKKKYRQKVKEAPTQSAEDLQADYDDTYTNILRYDLEEIEKYSKRVEGYSANQLTLWQQLQGATAEIFVAQKEGRIPKLSPKIVGQLARILQTLGPNPIDHWRDIVSPQQDAMAVVESLPVLRVEVMTPEDVADLRRQQESEDGI